MQESCWSYPERVGEQQYLGEGSRGQQRAVGRQRVPSGWLQLHLHRLKNRRTEWRERERGVCGVMTEEGLNKE